ncbi:Ras-related protein RABF2a [Abeliophyllum distichum]|uniref:Ras-related protein RABF2a n=1 Tax=Abeliophyllum distichum TaxID=126358 RepID=A0ABD1RCZ3_9LAMI
MIVYDITNKESFRQAKKFVNQLRKKCKLNIVMTLAGNKADLLDARKVAAEEAQAFAQENGLFFMETSAKTETNVLDMFYEIAKRLPIEKRLPDHSHHQPLLNPIAGPRGFLLVLPLLDSSVFSTAFAFEVSS